MHRSVRFGLVVLVFLVSLVRVGGEVARAAEADAILGRWQTEDEDGHRDSIVEIRRDGDAYVGRVVWVKYAVYPDDDPRGWAGRPVVDRENPDPALRTRSLLGVDVLRGLRFDGDAWSEGEIYSPRKGTTYAARAWLEAAGTLKIRGGVGSISCESHTADSDLYVNLARSGASGRRDSAIRAVAPESTARPWRRPAAEGGVRPE